MASLAVYPTVLTATSGLNRVITKDEDGFPDQGMVSKVLFTETSGTTVDDMLSASNGLVEAVTASNNAYAWLSGGGLQLDGTQIVSFPEFDVREPFTLASLGGITGSVGGTATERWTGLIGFRDWATGNYRGALLYARGGNDWNAPTTAIKYAARPANGAGGLGAPADLLPASGLSVRNERRVHLLSYNGADAIICSVLDENAVTIASLSVPVTDVVMTTGSGAVVDNLIQPILGGPNGSYNGGRQQIEAYARWNRVLNAAEIALLCEAGSALGAARGRAW